MMTETISGWTGYFYLFIKKIFDAGRERPESIETRVEKVIEEEKKKVVQIYNSKGQIIEYCDSGRHLDIIA